jgi:hypothetical protein
VVALVGAGAGALIGGTHGGNKGEYVGETIYNWKSSF